MSARLSPAQRRAVESCTGGVWLACDEETGAYLWPRCVYPALDDALVADHELAEGYLDPDLDYPVRSVRIVWAREVDDDDGWWTWRPTPPPTATAALVEVECWELTW